jgi:amidohydrolase
MSNPLFELDDSLRSWVVDLRRWFHQHPEPGFAEHRTQARIMEELSALGIEHRKAGGTGVVGTIHAAGKGRMVALRADIDALSIQEAETERNRDYRSLNPGVMHACGHDGHVAMVLGVARRLQEHRDELKGNVRLIFQPAEESPPGGAIQMIEDGCLDGVDAIVGVHLFSTIPSGRLAFRPGPLLATNRTFVLTIKGRPGHHMCPQDCIDPIQIAARFITSIQGDLRQQFPPDTVYVLGFGQVQAGTQHNQTPGEATVVGTFRAFDQNVSERIAEVMKSTMDGLVQTFSRPGVLGLPSYEFRLDPSYPVLFNDPKFTARAAQVLKANLPDVDDAAPANLGAEDFASYLEKVPGMFTFLGCRNEAKGIVAGHHSDRFDIDEDALAVGVKAFLVLAEDFLRKPTEYLGG